MRITFLFLLVFCLLFLGCESQPAIKKIGDKKTIEVRVNKEFVIPLYANPTTGYQWQLTEPLNKEFLSLVSNEYLTEEVNLIGAGCEQEWKFRAVKPGRTIVSLKYVRPWEKSSRPEKIVEFEVNIH